MWVSEVKAFVTSTGEPTRDLCIWSLERRGFEVVLLEDESTTLAQKLAGIYVMTDDDFVRVDADVIVTRPIDKTIEYFPATDKTWWLQFQTYDMYKQRPTNGGIQFIRREALPALRANIGKFLHDDRPETRMWNLDEFHKPRRCQTHLQHMAGLHGFGRQDLERVKKTKLGRKEPEVYDFELAEKLMEFYK